MNPREQTDPTAMLAEGSITILAGAGVSAPAPTCLPGWWTLNDAVLGALGEAVVACTNRRIESDDFRAVVQERRDSTPFLKPDLQAQLIEDEIGPAYFEALANVDSEEPNAAHALLAELARQGHVGAIVTTNFDCVIERALDAAGVPYNAFESPKDFKGLTGSTSSLLLVKVHGSTTRPQTMVDTLRQRLRGRPAALERWMLDRFARHPTIGVGFSCEDLEYHPDYLSIRPALRDHARFAFLVREGSGPSKPLRALESDYPDQVRISTGTLPGWLFDISAEAGVKHDAPAPVSFSKDEVETLRDRALAKLEAGLADWSSSLSRMEVVNAVTSLLSSAGHRNYADYMLRRMWEFDREPEDCCGTAYGRYLFNYGETLLREARLLNPHDRETEPAAWRQAADIDPGQFFFRAVDNGHTDDALARLLLCEFLAGENISSFIDRSSDLCERLIEAARDGAPLSTAQIDAAFSLTELLELLGVAQGTPPLHRIAHHSAAEIGDEFRRAEAAWRWARALAYSNEEDPALLERITELTEESIEIAARLDIRESDAGAALSRSIAASVRAQWDSAAAEARAAEEVYAELKDEWGRFCARRERLRALIGGGLANGTIRGSDFDELSEALQRFSLENAPGIRPLVKLEIAKAASYFDDQLATELATDARNEGQKQEHPVVGDLAEKLLDAIAEQRPPE